MKSNHNYVLELSEEAYDDLLDIQNYTYIEHGENQWSIYGRDLDAGMAHILQNPQTGHRRDDVPEGYLTWTVREHVMIYRIENETIYLVRILHGRMNFKFQF